MYARCMAGVAGIALVALAPLLEPPLREITLFLVFVVFAVPIALVRMIFVSDPVWTAARGAELAKVAGWSVPLVRAAYYLTAAFSTVVVLWLAVNRLGR